MALNKTTLKNKLVEIFSKSKTESNVDQVATELSDAIDAYIKTATIVYVAGLTTPAGGGAVTGTFNGNLQ